MAGELEAFLPFLQDEAVGLGLFAQGLQKGLGLPLVAGLHQAFGVEKALFPEEGRGELGE